MSLSQFAEPFLSSFLFTIVFNDMAHPNAFFLISLYFSRPLGHLVERILRMYCTSFCECCMLCTEIISYHCSLQKYTVFTSIVSGYKQWKSIITWDCVCEFFSKASIFFDAIVSEGFWINYIVK